MSRLGRNRDIDMASRISPIRMTVTTSTKAKSASKAGASAHAGSKQKTQMHRRSRTGCYTCRLRRKKCDEGSPTCGACKNLGLSCEYKRPLWWGNNEARRHHKDEIKRIIKRKKLSEKSVQVSQTAGSSPPALSHSLPTSATFSDPADRTRSQSIDSRYGFHFNSPASAADLTPFATPQLASELVFLPFPPFSALSPCEADGKTEQQLFVADGRTCEVTTPTFSAYDMLTAPGTLASTPFSGAGTAWTESVCSDRRTWSDEASDGNLVDPARQVAVDLDEGDRFLLEHFLQHVLPTLFPMLESSQDVSVSADLVLPALQSNRCYLHCCLGIAAQHLKSTVAGRGEDMDDDIMRHRYATISSLCDALGRDEKHQQILEATLGLIFFQCCVGRFDDALPDIPWHQHLQAAVSLVQKLDLPRATTEGEPPASAPFSMSLTAWIDILGATIQGRVPMFAHTYREKLLSAHPQLGLRELMGCDDRVMYVIAETACLEALRREGMDDMTLCQHVAVLGEQMGLTETGEDACRPPFNADGSLNPQHLRVNTTAAFRLAARVYLCSLVPGFHPSSESCVGLVDKLTATLQAVPAGPHGFDRSLAWVYLVAGAFSSVTSSFRPFFEDRVAQLGPLADDGSFGRVICLLRETWLRSSASAPELRQPYVHWRDVMAIKGWDFLII